MTTICVFAGSSAGVRQDYVDAAATLGQALAARGIGIVYGGARVGLMGALADAALAAGGQVTGVIPEALVAKELAHTGLTRLHVVSSMHERKALMASLSTAFIALPGGWGTLEELFEVLTWSQLGLHAKPCGLLNVAGYYDALLRFLEGTVTEGFVRPEYLPLVAVGRTPEELLRTFESYEPPRVTKWIDPAES